MKLVKNDDGSWRNWDASRDDCMDRVETIEVAEVPKAFVAGAISYLVYIGQINQTCIGVTARNEDEARQKAENEWRREWSEPEVISVERCE